MLGIGNAKEELRNNLVQIGTGEGKSITLGVTASILALLGFDVRCACYSQYLSQRDYNAFSPLFDVLGVTQYIQYGTFNKLCEDMINRNGEIRQMVEQFISTDSNNSPKSNQRIERAKILLIDEVDVFFSQDFYGNVYTPSASLRNPTITSLINFIWTQRKAKLNLNKVKDTNEYKACCDRFPNWEPLIVEAVKDLICDVNSFETHDYVVKEDKIGYKEQDNIVYNIVYCYKTLFAYYCEYEQGKITKKSLEEKVSINIKCGSFSYAEIPHQFNFIMGVTGTLDTLNRSEKKIMEDIYKIDNKTFTPSVFGENKLTFIKEKDVKIENNNGYFNAIKSEIGNKLAGSSGKRAVLVFFESATKLREFYESKELETIKNSVLILTEEANSEEKETIIKRATESGQITLFTRTFGRGTDFICYEESVKVGGGTHVIQTFLSEKYSEEKQIKGRTARQGDCGSYSMLLLDQDLEKFLIQKEDIENVKNGIKVEIRFVSDSSVENRSYETIYDFLGKKRNALFEIHYENSTAFFEQVKERHEATEEFLKRFDTTNMNYVRTFLVNENKGANIVSSQSRTICLMDATISMTHLLHHCKNTVKDMFDRTAEILREANISEDSFQIQFVIYRNYNSTKDKILQFSPWETRADYLRAFMNTIDISGGLGNEAIEIGLWHANQENEREKITQVILIGDAPPNTKGEVAHRRGRYGEAYWKKTKFAQITYYEDELTKLTSNNIPVHAFYVERRAEQSFRQIANQTGGRCQLLDVKSSSGAQILTDLVAETLLVDIGGLSKGKSLVAAYREKFGKAYA
ncbi:unnamed protein product [Rotaria magnacalcarata]|uniref:SecA family profile domain-containing protein n=1 Tax=Rotaria magnacalcarata TaxID=392030 RepID=A0A816RE32_9BILA|nr:unnamed protein product [Rotaria magnacalcarata]CAF3947279.1 unnamed protein product [Rotaria magnacalcarata]